MSRDVDVSLNLCVCASASAAASLGQCDIINNKNSPPTLKTTFLIFDC